MSRIRNPGPKMLKFMFKYILFNTIIGLSVENTIEKNSCNICVYYRHYLEIVYGSSRVYTCYIHSKQIREISGPKCYGGRHVRETRMMDFFRMIILLFPKIILKSRMMFFVVFVPFLLFFASDRRRESPVASQTWRSTILSS